MDLSQILLAVSDPNPQVREPAEAALRNVETGNLAGYLTGLCTELANNQRPVQLRQQAGLALKNTVAAKSEAKMVELSQRWMMLDENVRRGIREVLLGTLADPVKDIRSTAALAIGKIAAIEIPANLWLNLVDVLASNITSSSDPNLKQACFEALGYVCEECGDALQEKSPQVLTAIGVGMAKDQTNNAIKLAATQALANSLDFVKENMAREHERNIILTMIFSVTPCEDPAVRVAAYQCLVQLAGSYYLFLPQYINEIFALTANAIQKEEEDVALQAIEFWATLAEEERTRALENEEAKANDEEPTEQILGFTEKALPQLLPLILQSLTKQNEDVNDDTWNVAMAAGTCLGLMAEATRDAIVPHVIPFVQAHIAHEHWRLREAAVLSFGFILDGPSKTVLAELVKTAFPFLIKYMKDPDIHVRDTAAWTIGRVCDLLPKTIDSTMLPMLMETLLGSLTDSPKIASNVCWAIHNLADAVEHKPGATSSALSPYFEHFVRALLVTSERTDSEETNLIPSAYETINVLINNATPDMYPFISTLIPTLCGKLNATFSNTSFTSGEQAKQSDIQGYLCGALQCIIQILPLEAIKPYAHDFMRLFLTVLSSKSYTVHEEALMAVGALANRLEGDFATYMQPLATFLMQGLQNWSQYQVCAVAVGVVGDVSRALEGKILPYCDAIVQVLLGNLANASLERSVKPPIIACLGDIAMAVGGNFERYMPYVMMMLSQASMTTIPNPSYDDAQYLKDLRENVLSTYTSIVQGLNSDSKSHAFAPFVVSVAQFLNLLATENVKDASTLRAAAGLIGDLIQRLGGAVKGIFAQAEAIKHLINVSRQHKDKKTAEVGQWAYNLYQQHIR